MTKLWAIHLLGPDDIIAAASEADARAQIAELDQWLASRGPRSENHPNFKAEVIEWPFGPEAHARSLTEYAALSQRNGSENG